MNEINACFISYRHTDDPEAHKFVQMFVKLLKKQLAWLLPKVPVFFDEEGLKVGDQYNEELAYQLCRSACMVMFFSPCHFDSEHPYCAQEYHAMRDLEQRRIKNPEEALIKNKSLILPVIFRGMDYLPQELKNNTQHICFDHIVIESDFKNKSSQAMIKTIAERIQIRYEVLRNAGVFESEDCGEFSFPEKAEIMPWLQEIAQSRKQKMPGR